MASTETSSVGAFILKRAVLVHNHASTETSSAGGDKSFAAREFAVFV
jgi:hypothetical protein